MLYIINPEISKFHKIDHNLGIIYIIEEIYIIFVVLLLESEKLFL